MKGVRIDVLSVLPEIFEVPLSTSMIGMARERGVLEIHVHDLRTWTHDRHRTTDDYPYGGGPGMVMKPEPLFEAVRAIRALDERSAHTIILGPRGATFIQRTAEHYARMERLLLVCGRYEGFDERVYSLADEVVSVGDYVLTGGELPAMVIVDAVTRLLPGVLGHQHSAEEESFTTGLLEYPHYTRPAVFEGIEVPKVLRSGNHKRIAAWRREQAIRMTARFRPDLLASAALTDAEWDIAREELERSTEE